MDVHYVIWLISYILVIVGALNWGMVGVFGVDVVARLFGSGSLGAKIVYILIGIAAIVLLILWR
ncbi:MAG: DUF378 domain-containing protein [Alphaproteobacteria bacterium]|nr:DUF378 domain-containing protein [Alphaproteobacteria bacterium]